MKFGFRSILLLMFILIPALLLAQHSVQFNFTQSTTPGIAGYNAYRAICTGTISGGVCSAKGTNTKLGAATPTMGLVSTYTDLTPLAGEKYVYVLTSVCPPLGCTTTPPIIAGESGPSVEVAVVIPTDKPLPPTNVAITQISLNQIHDKSVVVANFEGTPKMKYVLKSVRGKTLAKGKMKSSQGTYTLIWSGKSGKPLAGVTLKVCGTDGQCDVKSVT